MIEREKHIVAVMVQFIQKQQNGFTFENMYEHLLEQGIITDDREEKKRVIALMRDVEVNGKRASMFVCPLQRPKKT